MDGKKYFSIENYLKLKYLFLRFCQILNNSAIADGAMFMVLQNLSNTNLYKFMAWFGIIIRLAFYDFYIFLWGTSENKFKKLSDNSFSDIYK